MKTCVHCGSRMPDESGFCFTCGRRQEEPPLSPAPRLWRRKALFFACFAAVCLLLVLGMSLFRSSRSFSADGPELLYSDGKMTYRLFLSVMPNKYGEPVPTDVFSTVLSESDQAARVSCLYVRDPKTGADLQDAFLEQLSGVRVRAVPGSEALAAGILDPEHNESFPGSAVAATVLYSAETGENEIVWELNMKNGDRIRLSQRFQIGRRPTLTFTDEDAPMDTLADLQALLDRIYETDGTSSSVTIYLPPRTYEGGLHLHRRSVQLIGSAAGERQTTFTGAFTVDVRAPQVAEFHNIAFLGDGGAGITAHEAVFLQDCTFSGWDIGACALEGSWIAANGCRFENNRVGFESDSGSSSMSHPAFPGCSFLGNDTALLLLRVPDQFPLDFQGCVFSGNTVDIENRAGVKLDTSEAEFR